MPWADATYRYKMKITIDKSKVAGDEVNYPVLISITNDKFKSVNNGGHVQSSNGYDICFYDSTEKIKLNHEIEVYTATTGVLVFWVCIPSLSSTSNTVFYMYYGKVGVTVNPSSTSTWDANYTAVWHMKDATTSTIGDSTSSALTGTKQAANKPIETTSGKIANAQDFELSDGNYIALASSNVMNNADGTLEMWFNPESVSQVVGADGEKLIGSAPVAADKFFLLFENTWPDTTHQKHLYFSIKDNNTWRHIYSDDDIVAGNWYYVVVWWGAAGMKMYINSVLQANTNAATNYFNHAGVVKWGMEDLDPASEDYYDGIIDETRISKSNRSANWITTTYNNQNSPSTFMSFGGEDRRMTVFPRLDTGPHVQSKMRHIPNFKRKWG